MLEVGVGQGEITIGAVQTFTIFLDFNFTTRFHIGEPIQGWGSWD